MPLKVCVYAISKNEEKHVRRFMESMREADGVYVLDTGSSDKTVSLLSSLGAFVRVQKIDPWRFDKARNASLDLVPGDADICVAADLDEEFTPGWREKLERVWTEHTQRARFKFVWSFRDDGSEGTVLWLDKIHARHGYHWKYAVHEVLERDDGREETAQEIAECTSFQLNHHPDLSKSRAQYLPLLELNAFENPEDARSWHYLGREYMYAGEWEKCIHALRNHLFLPQSLWREERSASYRFIARAEANLGNPDAALQALFCAIAEAPHLREPFFEAARLLLKTGSFAGAAFMAQLALKIKTRSDRYVTEDEPWTDAPEEIYNEAMKQLKK